MIGVNQDGAFAEQAVVPADCVFPIPDDLADETAALAEPFSIATHSLTRGRISAADRVLVIGAGPIGLYCALTARYMGAQTVHVSEPNPQRREMATKFGVASTDPTQEDAKESLVAASQGEGFDLVVETSGVRAGFDFAIEAAAVQGHLVLLGFPSGGTADIPITRCILKELELIGSRVCTRAEFQKTLDMLTAMQSGGEIDFGSLIAGARPLEDLDRAIHDVANGAENAKILIKPV